MVMHFKDKKLSLERNIVTNLLGSRPSIQLL